MRPRFFSTSLILVSLAAVQASQPKPPSGPPTPPAVIFAALAGGANPAPQTVAIASGAAMQVTGALPSWLTVAVNNQGSQTTATVTVNLANAPAGINHATIDFSSADKKILKKIYAWLMTLKALPDDSAYQVEFRTTGYGGEMSGPDCKVNPNGFDVLQGIVAGREAVPSGDDVRYRGTLGRMTSMDLCGTKGKRGPGDDELVWCAASLVGVASMKVQLDVAGDAGRGARLSAEPDGSWFTGSVQGSCETADMKEWEKEYPGGESGGSPGGQDIDESTGALPRLFANGHARLTPNTTFIPRGTNNGGNTSGWTMKVLAKLK